jgi:hypothetical protein
VIRECSRQFGICRALSIKVRAQMQELLSLSGKWTAEEGIIQKLADASLVTTEGDLTHKDAFVEVAHEALVRSWPQLRTWIDADRAGLRTRTRLTEATRDWKNADRDPAYLYTGARLAAAKEWEVSHPGQLSTNEAEFLRCSREAQKRLARDKRAQQLRNAAGIILTSLAAILAYIAIADNGLAVPGGDSVRHLLDHFNVSFFRPVHDKAEVQRAAALAQGPLTERLHGEDWLIRWDQPYSTGTAGKKFETWDSSQAICALLRGSASLNDGWRSDFLARLDASFSQEQLN